MSHDAKYELGAATLSDKMAPLLSLPTLAATMGVGTCYVKDESLRMDDSSRSAATPFREVFQQVRAQSKPRVTHMFVQANHVVAGASWLSLEASTPECDATLICICIGEEHEGHDRADHLVTIGDVGREDLVQHT